MSEAFDIQDVAAERAALGCMLQRHDALLAGIDGMNANDFAHEGNKRIYQIIRHMHEQGKGVDKVTVIGTLRLAEKLDHVGGELAIEKCVQGVPSLTNYREYMATVRDRASRRHIVDVANKIVRAARSEPSVTALLGMVEREVSVLRNGLQGAGGADGEQASADYVARLLGGDDAKDRFPLPIPSLNRATLGMRRGQVIVAAARPSDGKSLLFGTQLMLDGLRRKPEANYAMFSLEMTVEEVYGRMLADCGVDLDAFNMRTATPDDHAKLEAAVAKLKSYNYSIYGGNRPISEIVSMQRQKRHDVIVVDHLQHMVAGSWDLIPGIVTQLDDLAVETNCVVVLLSQLTRPQGEFKHKNLKPTMTELKGSSAIEEAADAIFFIWRKWSGSEQQDNGEILISKVRGGRRGVSGSIPILLKTKGELRFVELEVAGSGEVETSQVDPTVGAEVRSPDNPIPGIVY